MRYVGLGRFACVMSGMQGMRMSGMRVMSRLLMMTGGVVGGRLFMVFSRVLVVLGGLRVMSVRRMGAVRWFFSHGMFPFGTFFNGCAVQTAGILSCAIDTCASHPAQSC